MAKRSTKKARSLKRSSQASATRVPESKGLIRQATSVVVKTAKSIRGFVKKSLLAFRSKETKKQIQAAEKEAARVRRYYEIRDSNVTIIRGPLQVESSWVDKIAYVRYGRRNGVAVQFHDKQGNPTVQCFYPNTDIRDYDYLRKAASKGKAIWRRFYDLPYEIMN